MTNGINEKYLGIDWSVCQMFARDERVERRNKPKAVSASSRAYAGNPQYYVSEDRGPVLLKVIEQVKRVLWK